MLKGTSGSRQLNLPGITELRAGESVIRVRNNRIPHRKILTALESATEESAGLVEVYRSSVLPVKTRTIHLFGRKSSPRIINTLLGYEVQAAYKRIHCPDMATARYLKLFTELGCHSIRLPYDPTVTSSILPAMEGSVERLKRGVAAMFPASREVRTYVMRCVFRHLRRQLRALPLSQREQPAIPNE